VVDEFNRANFCYVVIGPYKLPVYQPGSVMFISAVKENSLLNIFHKQFGQNGPILGKLESSFSLRRGAN
jgi:hypothetical protein